jgi:hypothetical protein
MTEAPLDNDEIRAGARVTMRSPRVGDETAEVAGRQSLGFS